MENLQNYLRARLSSGATIDDLCEEFTGAINELNKNQFQEEVMDPLMDLIERYYTTRHAKEYAEAFPDGINQTSIEELLDSILEMGTLLSNLETKLKNSNLDLDEVAQELVKRIFA